MVLIVAWGMTACIAIQEYRSSPFIPYFKLDKCMYRMTSTSAAERKKPDLLGFVALVDFFRD